MHVIEMKIMIIYTSRAEQNLKVSDEGRNGKSRGS